jgi:DoxX-like family
MKNKKIIHKTLIYLIATVWIVNGLFCKLLNLVPRHQQIAARILGNEYAGIFTKVIGISEVLMAIWILSSIKPRLCSTAQIIIVATMNVIEFFLAPDLLLFGKVNSIIAVFFILAVYFTEFRLNKNLARQV